MSLNSLPYSVVKVDDPSRSGKTLGVSFRRHESGPFSDNTGNGFTCLGLGEERRKKKALSAFCFTVAPRRILIILSAFRSNS